MDEVLVDFQAADLTSLTVFVGIIIYILAAVVLGVYTASVELGGPAKKRAAVVAVGLILWLMFVSAVVGSGTLAASPMPRLLLFMAGSNLVAIALALSPIGGWLATGLAVRTLVAFQIFRLPLELVLHQWAESGTIPQTMTWSGYNFDIISGVFALAVTLFAGTNRLAAWMFNIVGFSLLANVIRVAVMSLPLPFAWGTNPPLMLGFHLPYAWIVPICVGGAMAGHIVLTRALLK